MWDDPEDYVAEVSYRVIEGLATPDGYIARPAVSKAFKRWYTAGFAIPDYWVEVLDDGTVFVETARVIGDRRGYWSMSIGWSLVAYYFYRPEYKTEHAVYDHNSLVDGTGRKTSINLVRSVNNI